MKKLLLLALPFCLLTSFVVRAEDAVQPTEQTPAQDPLVTELQDVLKGVAPAVDEHLKAASEAVLAAFADKKELLERYAKAYPDAVVTDAKGNRYMPIGFGNVYIPLS